MRLISGTRRLWSCDGKIRRDGYRSLRRCWKRCKNVNVAVRDEDWKRATVAEKLSRSG